MNICRLFVLACGAVGLLSGLVVSAPVAAARPSGPAPRTPIKHLVVLMQEQHSFDNYFGTYPGADGLPSTVCMPLNPRDPNSSNCVRPFHLQGTSIKPPANSILSFQRQYRDGHMDGFIDAFRQANRDGTATMGYYNEDDLSYYWQLAQDYVLFDRFFSSTAAGSLTNHLYWVAAAPGGPDRSTAGCRVGRSADDL